MWTYEYALQESKKIPDFQPTKPNVNILYFSDNNHKDYYTMVNFLDENNINYVPVLMHERMVNEQFIKLLLDFSVSGFDDIVRKSYFKTLFPDFVYEDVKTSKMISLLEKYYIDLLRPVIFVGDDGIIRTNPIKREFQNYTKEKK
jgi:hypothetical protein